MPTAEAEAPAPVQEDNPFTEEAPKKKRGRPPGSKSKKTVEAPATTPKKRGRPPGSGKKIQKAKPAAVQPAPSASTFMEAIRAALTLRDLISRLSATEKTAILAVLSS